MAQSSKKYAKLAFVLMTTDNMSKTLEAAANNANGSFSKYLSLKQGKKHEKKHSNRENCVFLLKIY